MHAQHRLALALATTLLLALAPGCARPASSQRDSGVGPGFDTGVRTDANVPLNDVPCGPLGQMCCAGSTCELGLRCARGTCCLQANSSTRCATSADCCTGLTCTSGVCCAGRSSTCTGSGDCCSGLVCSGGVCLSPDMGDLPGMSGCGGAGGTCCAGFTCRSGLVCNSTTGMCEGCGESGGRCCDGMTSCVSSSLVCNPMSGDCETAPDPTMRCGRIDGPCCAEDGVSPSGTGNCEGGLVCLGGTCSDPTDTGGMDQPCGPRSTCDAGLMCDHGSNTCVMTPSDCGHDMQMCCDTGAPSCDGAQHCQFGSCTTCQGPSLSCVLGGLLPGQTCCNGSVCRPAPLIPRCCVGADQPCTNSLDCCGLMMCRDGMCQAGREGSFCLDSSECADGLTCQTFMCRPDPMASCMPQGQSCTTNAECCAGFTCGVSSDSTVSDRPLQCCTGSGGACQSPADCCGEMTCTDNMCACRGVDDTCFRDAECCATGTDPAGHTGSLGCVAGACQVVDHCRRPGSATTACTGRPDCCEGLECLAPDAGSSMTVCCQQSMSPCQRDDDCCGTMTCTMGRCQCQGVGSSCANDTDCCGGATCQSGRCAV